MRGTGILVVVAGLVVVVEGLARAETPTERADELFSIGRDLIKAGDVQGACDKFEAAIAIDATAPGVMLNLGLCSERLGKLATALRWYRKAQLAASEARPRLADYENAATERTAELVTRVAKVQLALSAAQPREVEVRIDGLTIRPDDYTNIEIDSGTHQLVVRAPGRTTFTRIVTVVDAQLTTIQIPALASDGPDPSRRRRIVGITIGSIGLGAVIVIPFVAKHIADEFHRTGVDERGRERSMKILGGAWVGGVAAVAGGALLWLTARSREHRQQPSLVPVISPQHAGIAVLGAF